MDSAGTTIFDRIEQKLSSSGVEVDVTDLKEAISQFDAKIASNPADTDSKIIGLELKLVLVARLLNAAVEVLPQGRAAATACEASPFDDEAATTQKAVPAQAAGPKKKRMRQNPATGVIEEIEDDEGSELIVADGRMRFPGGKGGAPRKEDKKCVFIAATDDEPVTPKKK